MTGCSQGHEPPEINSSKKRLKFPVLAPSRNGNMEQRRYYSLEKTCSDSEALRTGMGPWLLYIMAKFKSTL